MQFIMFTKHLEGLDLDGIIAALKHVGVDGADLAVRPGYPVNPANAATALPAAARRFADEGLSIPLVTAPGDFTRPDMDYADDYYGACAAAGVRFLKLGYWHWRPGQDYWAEVTQARDYLAGFAELSAKHGVKTVVHTHSGRSLGLNAGGMMELVRGFDPAQVGVFADPGHLAICGEPIDMALNILQEYLSLLSFKDLVHDQRVREGKVERGSRVVRMGEGLVDWPLTLDTLQAMHFDGPISIHSEYSGEPVETVIDLARCDLRYVKSLL